LRQVRRRFAAETGCRNRAVGHSKKRTCRQLSSPERKRGAEMA
jgi:hypothetical protein